jgi:LmbE family N-acetylglucosaminyl deacetylase
MLTLSFERGTPPLGHVLCLGAHADDIEVGCSGTVLRLLDAEPAPAVTWIVFSGEGDREREALESAHALLGRARTKDVQVHGFRDGYFPSQTEAIKDCFERLKRTVVPDLVLTHQRGDLHQDHRVVAELTWNTFRNHLILEYEIPKYDGDLGTPNLFVPLDEAVVERKIANLLGRFPTQSGRHWFSDELFRAVLRLRGMEAATRYAEAFHCRKLVVS